jgi:outer membrane protein assembly factor BamA
VQGRSTFRLSALLLPCLFALLVALPARAQEKPAPGSGKLAAIKVTGSQRFDEATIVAATGLKLGQDVRRQDLQATADWLSQIGPFQNVRYKFTSLGDTVSVEYQLEDAKAVRAYFDNFPWLSNEEIAGALKNELVFFDGLLPENGTVLDAAARIIEKLLAARGVTGVVDHALMGEPGGDQMIIHFSLSGPVLKINAFRFEDPVAADSRRIALAATDMLGKPFSRFAVEMFLFEQVRPIYLERGHLRVRFGTPQARFTGDPNKPLADNVLVVIPIEPGPIYRWGGATWSGNAAFGPLALDEFLRLPVGEPVSGLRILAGWEKVKDEYARRGYVDIALNPVPAYDDHELRVTYRVQVTEGPAYKMGELVITGLSIPAERIVRGAWRITKGATFDRLYFDEFLATGIKQAFGDYVVHYDKVGHLLRTNPETRVVDVLLDFR